MRRKNTTTEFLKECMADALLRLLKEKPLEEITISEITELADVGRVTFYRNFTKKEDLIRYKMKILTERYFTEHSISADTDSHELARHVFTFIYSIRDTISILYDANIVSVSFFPFYESIRKTALGDSAKLFKRSFFTFGLMGIVTEWVNDGFRETPQELLEILRHMEI